MLLVGNGKVITRDETRPYLADGCVAVKDNIIAEVGASAELKKRYPEADFLDARGRVIMPGLINTHMHLYSTFARGMALKDAPPENFPEILGRLWWRLDKVLTREDIYYSAMVPLIDGIKNGTTTIFDHHASPGAVRESLFVLARAARAAGVRSSLCYEVSDRDGTGVMRQGIQENEEFIRHANSSGDEMIRGMFGLHASLTLSDQTLAACCQANAGTRAGFHVHVAEGIADVEDALARYGKRVVERLAGFGILGPQSLAIHCVHVNDREIDILKETGANVVHNPESNMGNAVGCAPVLAMLEKGVTVGLGTDGYTSDMLESFKVAQILHKHDRANPSVAWAEAPAMLFKHNPAISARMFPRPLGRLAPGCYADLIIVDYDPPTPLHENNADGHILFGMWGRSVATTIINGRIVMKERSLTGIDEAEIYAKARELSTKLWERF
ncbi:putative aminohydrolase SsnA [Candidatus Formimonas warabiya]|uniref:Chlorohydrolase n=1 Tax=Formimonas warabiya TaxID=1761012 RepID=A0A3G1KQT8_FORW1|nr:putative aminohydrolase SsnA [Candidatus Formimonas warabiya]ATW24842.1 chlorohydrolase [Candidatus Formimonas warabiya]